VNGTGFHRGKPEVFSYADGARGSDGQWAATMGVDTAGVRGVNPQQFEVGVANVFQPPRISEFGSVFNTFSQLNSCLETYFLFSEML
jgi:hypothetical protein